MNTFTKAPAPRSGHGGEEEDAPERQDGPVEGHAHEDRAAAAHAPDLVEDVLDRLEEEEDDHDQQERADDAGRARSGRP